VRPNGHESGHAERDRSPELIEPTEPEPQVAPQGLRQGCGASSANHREKPAILRPQRELKLGRDVRTRSNPQESATGKGRHPREDRRPSARMLVV
jgi:hypothetical protein